MTSISIPNSVTSIGDGAFRGCSSLTSISIPNSVTSIGDGAFYYCSSLTSITCEAVVPPIANSAFTYQYTSATLYVPSTAVDDYKTSSYEWSKFAEILPLSENTHISLPSADNASLQPATIYTLDGQRTDGSHQVCTSSDKGISRARYR